MHLIIRRYSAEPSRIHPRESWTRPLVADLSQIAEAHSIIRVHPCMLCGKSNTRTGVALAAGRKVSRVTCSVLLLNAMLKYVPRKYRLSVRPAEPATSAFTIVKPLASVACKFFRVPNFTPRGQKLKSLPPLRHVHQLFQRYKEFLGIRRWRSSDLDTLPVRDSAMNSQTVASFVIPHVSKSASNLKRLGEYILTNP